MWRCALISLLALLAMGPGCQPRNTGPLVTITRTPEFHLDSLKSVAYLGMGSSVPDPLAVQLMEPAIQSHLLAATCPFLLLRLDEVERRVRIAGADETFRAVRDYWRDEKKIDKFKAAELCKILGADGILIGCVVDWLQVDAASSAQQVASTRVIASLSLFPAGEGRPAWRAEVSHTVESQAREQGTRDPYAQTARSRELQKAAGVQARSRTRDAGAPGFEDVVEAVATALVKALTS